MTGYEEVYTGQEERFAERLELVGVELDAGPVGRLEEPGPRGCDAVPSLGVEVGGEGAGLVEAAGGDVPEARGVDDLGVDLAAPEDGEARALGVFVEAREVNDGFFLGRALGDIIDEVEARADAHEVALERRSGHERILRAWARDRKVGVTWT
jgi:hypothetical protein